MNKPKVGVLKAADRAMAKAGLGSAGAIANRTVRQGLKAGLNRKQAIAKAVAQKQERRAGQTAGPSRMKPGGGKMPFDAPTRPGAPRRRPGAGGPIIRPLPGVPQPDPANGRGTIGPKLSWMKK